MKDDGLRGMAIAGLLCGATSWVVLGIVLAPLGLVFSIVSVKSKDATTKTIATIGVVVSAVALAVLLFSLAVIANLR